MGCIGTETNLGQCNYTALGLSNCDHTEDAGVRCNPGKPVCQNLVFKYARGYLHTCCVYHLKLLSINLGQKYGNMVVFFSLSGDSDR